MLNNLHAAACQGNNAFCFECEWSVKTNVANGNERKELRSQLTSVLSPVRRHGLGRDLLYKV